MVKAAGLIRAAGLWAACLPVAVPLGLSGVCYGQTGEVSPVYIADAPLAEEALGTVGAMLERGGEDEAVRLVQRVLDEQGDRLIASDEAELFVPVRQRVHATVLADARLLGAYRVRQSPRASALLAEGRWREVERSYWLTEAGFEGSLRLAQTLIESARFASGLRVLGELEGHPDAPLHAPDAAALAALGASYENTDGAWALATRWSARAGLAPPERRAGDRPAMGTPDTASALDWRGLGAPEGTLEGVVPRSLHAGQLTELEPEALVEPGPAGAARPELPWSMPTLAGADLFTNDGLTLSCFDRFTLRPRWRLRDAGVPEEGGTRSTRSRLGRLVEDSASVTVEGDAVYASLGLAVSNTEEPSCRVVCVDRATGRVRWSVTPGRLSEDLAGAEPRGPVVVSGDVVVVGARKNLRSRRLVGLTLLGLDRRTGELRWARALGSAGSLPFQQLSQLAEGGAEREGVVFWTDKIGLVAAIDAPTGRVRWVRETTAPGLVTRSVRTPFATSLPVVTDAGVFVLTPDGAQILRLSPEDGAVLSARPAMPSGEAGYLVRVGDWLACVGATAVAFYDVARFDERVPRMTGGLDPRAIRGRACAAGGRLAVPVEGGLALVDPEGSMRVEKVELETTGNVVVGEGQAVVVDECEARSYLSWETASAMLQKRVGAGDVDAALSLAELAQRSGREERVLDAVDAAVGIVRAGTDDAARGRVFDVVRRLSDPEAGGGSVGVSLRGALLERLGRLARGPEQRVAYAMALGSWKGSARDAPGAALAYQDLLLDPALAKTIWSGGGLSVRAELEATRRLQELADRFGAGATGASDRLAAQEAAALSGSDDPEAWAVLARRYPVSPTAWSAWERAATAWLRAGRVSQAERGARTGVRAASAAARRGQAVDRAVIDGLGGALLSALELQGRGDEGPAALAELAERFGAITPTLDGRPVVLDPGMGPRRAGALGPRFTRSDTPALVTGSPLEGAGEGDPARVLTHAPQLRELAMYRAEDGILRQVWRVDGLGAATPVVVHADASGVVLVWPAEIETGRPEQAEARDARTGEVLWSVNIRERLEGVSILGPDPASRRDGQIVTPLDGVVLNAQTVAACDGRTLVVTDRQGRAMGVDAGTGRELWRRGLAMTRVYGIDIGGGVLGVCGATVRASDPDDLQVLLRGVGEAIDPRTGETFQLLDDLGPETRWVRVAPDGQVVVGAGTRLVALDTVDGRVDWSNSDEELVASEGAWVLGETLAVLGGDGTLWAVSRREGVRGRTPIDTLGRAGDRGWISLQRRGDGFVAIGSTGLTAHDAHGSLLAADAIETDRAFVVSTLGERRGVLVERSVDEGEGRTVCGVALVDARTGRVDDRVVLQLPRGVRRLPVSVVAADGVVVIGFGEVSVALPAPGGEG